MSTLANGPKCESEFTYENQKIMVCAQYFHEWNLSKEDKPIEKDTNQVVDTLKNTLPEGDTILIVKGLRPETPSILRASTLNVLSILENAQRP